MDSSEGVNSSPVSNLSSSSAELGVEINFRRIFEFLRAGRWTIAAVTIAAVLIGFLYSVLAAPVFEADGLVQVEQSASQGIGADTALSSLLTGAPVETEAEIQILKSRMIASEVIQKMNLQVSASPKYFPYLGLGARIARFHNSSEPTSVPAWLRAYAWGGEKISVSTFQVPESFVDRPFTLTRTTDGYALTNSAGVKILDGIIGQTAEADTDNGHFSIFVRDLVAQPNTTFLVVSRSQQFLLRQLSGTLQVLEQGRQSGVIKLSFDGASAGFVADVINNIEDAYVKQNVERRSADAQQSLAFLQKQLPDMKAQVEAAQASLQTYQTQHGSIDVTGETQAILAQSVDLETKRLILLQQRDQALQHFTPEHPTIKALDEQVRSLDEAKNSINQKSKLLPSTQQEIFNRTRDLQVNSGLYTEMLNSIQQLEIAKAGTIGNVRVVDHALKPQSPIKPQKPLILVISLFLGLFLGTGTVFAQRALLRGVDDPSELEARFGLTTYAMIPFAAEQRRLNMAMARPSASSGNFILASLNSASVAVEAIRSLRTSLHFAMLEASNNIILFTGPSPGLGKSFVTINLATVLALTGKRVAVVDADLRKGHLHLFIGAEPKPGVSDFIVGEADLSSIIGKTSIDGLDVISRGTHPPNPAELLLHERFDSLLKSLSSSYDLVLIDSPPVLAVTDAAIIGRAAGCTLVVLKAAEHPLSEIEETLKRLKASGSQVRGVIFNQVGARAGSYGYGGYGYAYYNYE